MNQESAQHLLDNTDKLSAIGKRLKAPSPSFFRKISTIMISLAGFGTSMLGVPATMQALGVEFSFPQLVNQISAYMIVAGVIGTFISKLTIDKDKVTEIAEQE